VKIKSYKNFVPNGEEAPSGFNTLASDTSEIVTDTCPYIEASERSGVNENFKAGGINHIIEVKIGSR
jgi:hypothetical protein